MREDKGNIFSSNLYFYADVLSFLSHSAAALAFSADACADRLSSFSCNARFSPFGRWSR